jgi:hypothetical protein
MEYWREIMYANTRCPWRGEMEDILKLNIQYRDARKQLVPAKSSGQGRGIEKNKLNVGPNGEFNFVQEDFIKYIGDNIGFPYAEKWFTNKVKKHTFIKQSSDKKTLATYKQLIERKDLMSLIFSDTTGKIDFTLVPESIMHLVS